MEKKDVSKKSAKKKKPSAEKNIRRKKKIRIKRILFTAAALLIVAGSIFLLLPRSGSDISIAQNALGSLITPAQTVFTEVAQTVKGFFTDWHRYDVLRDEYDELQRQYNQLRLEMLGMNETELENERLTELLGAQDTYASLEPIYAKVIARDAGEWFDTFSINKGSASGLSVGMAVVCGDGLLGKLYEVGLNYAKVISIIDSRSSVAVLVQRTRDNGVMRGQVTTSSVSSDCYLYRLPNVNNIMPGDKIVTSGTDGQYVKGLYIGTITAVSMDETLDGNYTIVSPSADFRHVEEVLVLRQAIETDSDSHQALPTPSPKPVSTPNPYASPTPLPTANPDIYVYPSAGNIGTITGTIENLPEDSWAEN